MTLQIDRFPIDDQSNGWSALLAPRQPRASLHTEQTVDWLVIGAGYAGLAAARQLAELEPEATIVILEAGQVGENASGRNSGFAIDLPHASSTAEDLTEQGKRTIRVGRYAIETLDQLIHQHQIACDWQATGRYHVAVTPAVSQRVLRQYEKNLQAWAEPYEWVDKNALKERLGTGYYHSAIYTPGTYLMNPAALVRGLADTLPDSVTLYENSAVIEVDWRHEQPYARTAHGGIRAKKIILATNAYSQLFGVYQERQVPVLLFASLTTPLHPEQIQRLGSDASWGVTPAHGVAGSTLRLTADRRLLIRQGFEYSPHLNTTDSRRHKARAMNLKLLQQRFPQLPQLELEHFWMGWLAVSQNHAPAFGQIAPNAFAVSCCNGSGIVRHTAAGMLIAELAAGVKNPLLEDFLVQGVAKPIPPRPWRDVGVKSHLWWEMWRGQAEQ